MTDEHRTTTQRITDAIADQLRGQRGNYASPYARRLQDAITASGTTPAESSTGARPGLVEVGQDPREAARRRQAGSPMFRHARDVVRARRGLPPVEAAGDDDEPTGTDQRPETDRADEPGSLEERMADDLGVWLRNGGLSDPDASGDGGT